MGKRFIFMFLAMIIYVNVHGAMSNGATDQQIVTSSGTTVITFDKYTNEIYIIRESTNAVYIDLYTVACTSSSYSDYMTADSSATGKDQMKLNVESKTYQMSIWTDNLDTSIRITGRHWE